VRGYEPVPKYIASNPFTVNSYSTTSGRRRRLNFNSYWDNSERRLSQRQDLSLSLAQRPRRVMMRMARRMKRLPVALVLANALFWTVCTVGKEPLGVDYFRERDGRVRDRLFFEDVDPQLVLAERPFAYYWVPEPRLIQVGLRLNIPAFFLIVNDN
jgi:hypothetical protein